MIYIYLNNTKQTFKVVKTKCPKKQNGCVINLEDMP